MDCLQIPLTLITAQGCPVDAEVPAAALRPAKAAALPLETLSVQGVLTAVGTTVLFRGRVRGVFMHACDRCLEEAETPFDVEVIWDFEEGSPPGPFEEAVGGSEEIYTEEEQPPEPYTFQGNEVDLGLYVWEEAALAAPTKYLCRDECQGLCEQCGSNLNAGSCGCLAAEISPTPGNSGLAALAKLLPELEAEEREE